MVLQPVTRGTPVHFLLVFIDLSLQFIDHAIDGCVSVGGRIFGADDGTVGVDGHLDLFAGLNARIAFMLEFGFDRSYLAPEEPIEFAYLFSDVVFDVRGDISIDALDLYIHEYLQLALRMYCLLDVREERFHYRVTRINVAKLSQKTGSCQVSPRRPRN